MMLLATVFVACSDDDDKDEKDNDLPEEPTETIDYWYITLNVDIPSSEHNIFITCAQADSVNWGNTGSEFVKVNFWDNDKTTLKAPFYNSGSYTITIKGHEPITEFGCSTSRINNGPLPDPVITSFDVSAPESVEKVSIDNTKMTSIDLSKYTALTEVYISENRYLATINISSCQKLNDLWCSNNQLTSLDVSNCTNLVELSCSDNQLTSLDVSNCTELNYLGCRDNNFNDNAMNAIYNGLPDRTGKEAGNMYGGAKGDKTIAKRKNWVVR